MLYLGLVLLRRKNQANLRPLAQRFCVDRLTSRKPRRARRGGFTGASVDATLVERDLSSNRLSEG